MNARTLRWLITALGCWLGAMGTVAWADGQGNADVEANTFCMEESYFDSGGKGGGLNCTANDIGVAGVATDANGDPKITFLEVLDDNGNPDGEGVHSCRFEGDTVRFSAEFILELTAQERHDIGIYFATDGDENADGALTSDVADTGCVVATPAYAPDLPWLDLDGTLDTFPGTNTTSHIQDTCGDIDEGHTPLFPVVEVQTECVDSDGDGQLNLPVCLSWRQPGANDLCVEPLDAIPGSPSKCNCDQGFNVPIIIPEGSITVTKAASPTQIDEPGDLVTYTVTVTNEAPAKDTDDFDVTVTDIIDDTFGVIYSDSMTANPVLSDNTCLTVDKTLTGQETLSCSFKAQVSGNGNDTHTNIVTGTAVDSAGRSLEDSDNAVVTILDVLPSITVTKTANPTEVLEPGADVTFAINVANNSVEAVTLDSLNDTVFGDLSGLGDCATGGSIAVSGSYSCSFTQFIGGNADDIHKNTVTAIASDDEGNDASDTDTAMVTVKDVPSMIEVVKTATPTSVGEPGGTVSFSVIVNNKSTVDTVTISSLSDDIHGNLDGQGTCSVPQTLAASESYSCAFEADITGNAGDSETDVVTASGTDDDGNPVSDNDDATVSIKDVAPDATLKKTVKSALVTYQVDIKNTSNGADPLTVDQLTDMVDGVARDIINGGGAIEGTTCQLGVTIQPGNTYTCEFDARLTESETDTVTGRLSDDENNNVQPDPSDSATVELTD